MPAPKYPSDCNCLMPDSSYAHSESGRIGIRYELIQGQVAIRKRVKIENRIAPFGQRYFLIGPIGHRNSCASSSLKP